MGPIWVELPPLVKAIVVVVAVAIVWELGVVPVAVGAIAGAVLFQRYGFPPELAVGAGLLAAVAAYVVSCLLYPRTKCVVCSGRPRTSDGDGNFRNCWMCGGSGQRRRVGAKVLRRHRRFVGR